MPAEDIYSLLSSIPHNSFYLMRYINFIENCLIKNSHITILHKETHHICPRSLFPQFVILTENKWNSAILTPRQHFISHLILSKVYPKTNMVYAANRLMNSTKNFKVCSRTYENLKSQISKSNSEMMKLWHQTNEHPRGMKGKSHSDNTKEILSKIMQKENNPMFGKRRKDLSESNIDPLLKMVRGYTSAVTKRDKTGHFKLFNINPSAEINPLLTLKIKFIEYIKQNNLFTTNTVGRYYGKRFLDCEKISESLNISKRTVYILYNLNTESPFCNWSTRTYDPLFSTQTK